MKNPLRQNLGNEQIKVSDLADVPKGFTGEVAAVTDHGNVTLYRYSNGRRYEIWGLV